MTKRQADKEPVMTLAQLVATIKACIAKSDQAGDKYEQFAIATGKHLADAKLRLEAKNKSIHSQKKTERTEQAQTWPDFLKEHFDFSKTKANVYIRISDGRASVAKLRTEKAEQMRIARKRTPRGVQKSKEEKPLKVQPAIKTAEEQGTYAALRDRAADLGYRLRRAGKQYDMSHRGKTDRLVNLAMVKHVLDINEGRVRVVVSDECSDHPQALNAEMNREQADAFEAARRGKGGNYLHERLSVLLIEMKKLTEKSTDRFAGCKIEPADLEYVADFLRQVAVKIRGRATTNPADNTMH
jgi:hypothetical protein